MSGRVGQDLSFLMTLVGGRSNMAICNWHLLPKFSKQFFTEIFESLNFDCYYHYHILLSFLYIITVVVFRKQSEISDHIKTSRLIWIANLTAGFSMMGIFTETLFQTKLKFNRTYQTH